MSDQIGLLQQHGMVIADRMPRSSEDVERIVGYFESEGLTREHGGQATYLLGFPTVIVTRYTRAQLEGLTSDELIMIKEGDAICLNRYLRGEEEVAQLIEACVAGNCCYPGGSEDEESPRVYVIKMPGQAAIRVERISFTKLVVV